MTGEADPTERQVHLATLRADRDIQAWFKDHRSTHTAEVQLQQLELFLRRTGTSPEELVALGRAQRKSPEVKDRGLSQLVQKWVDSERKAGRPDSYIATNWAAVQIVAQVQRGGSTVGPEAEDSQGYDPRKRDGPKPPGTRSDLVGPQFTRPRDRAHHGALGAPARGAGQQVRDERAPAP